MLAPDEVTDLEVVTPFNGLPLAQAINGLASTNSRSMGGEVGAALLAGSFAQLSSDLIDARHIVSNKDTELQRVNTELSAKTTRVAVLEERLGSLSRNQRIKQIAVFAGTVLLSVAIDLWKSNNANIAVIIGLLGAVLLAFGGFSPAGGSK